MKNLIYPFFSYLTLFALYLTFIFFILLLFKKTRKFVLNLIGIFGFLIILGVSFLAMIGSLLFSEILKWTPCNLCWYQRILMYPQVLISLIALKINDQKAYFYHFFLSFFGFFIALFHYLIQREVIKGINCNLIAVSESCVFQVNFAFGFVSIPFMALTSFLIILLVSFFNLKRI